MEYQTGTFETRDIPVDFPTYFQILRPYLDMEKGPWIAGGAVRKAIMGSVWLNGDIDIFVPSQQAAFDFIDRLKSDLRATVKKVEVEDEDAIFAPKGAQADPGLKELNVPRIHVPVQVIYFKTYETAMSVIESFDFTLCRAVSDGINWIADTRVIEDSKSRSLRFGSDSHFKGSVARVSKYLWKSDEYRPTPGLLRQALRADDQEAFEKLIGEHLYLAVPQNPYDTKETFKEDAGV